MTTRLALSSVKLSESVCDDTATIKMRNPDPLRDDPIEAFAAAVFVVVIITFLVFAAGVMIVFL